MSQHRAIAAVRQVGNWRMVSAQLRWGFSTRGQRAKGARRASLLSRLRLLRLQPRRVAPLSGARRSLGRTHKDWDVVYANVVPSAHELAYRWSRQRQLPLICLLLLSAVPHRCGTRPASARGHLTARASRTSTIAILPPNGLGAQPQTVVQRAPRISVAIAAEDELTVIPGARGSQRLRLCSRSRAPTVRKT